MFFVMCVLWLCKSLPLLSPQTNQFVVIVTFLPRPAIILSHVELRPAAIFPCQFYGAMIHIRNSKVVVPVDAMKPYREGRCMAPLILKSGARCWMISFTPRSFCPLERTILPVDQEAGFSSEPVCTIGRNEESHAPGGIRTANRQLVV